MVRVVRFAALTLFTAATLGLAVTAAQTPPAATYDAVFDVQGQQYVGTTTFMIDKAGKVSGTMKLVDPATVNAKLGGDVAKGVWTFKYAFTMDNQGTPCEGTLSGTAKVNDAQTEAAGDVTITGSCSPDPLAGTFKFTRKK
jgi:hypothetical protein